jgi:hypothetical protein
VEYVPRPFTEDELYKQIGDELSAHAGLTLDTETLIARGKKWFEINRSRLQEQVCGSSTVSYVLARPDETALVGAIVDAIAGICLGVAPGTVAGGPPR